MRIRKDKASNYRAIFFNGKTIRQRINPNEPISSLKNPEIEDVAINNKCFANCPYCYTSATSNGINFDNIVDKANHVWGNLEENDRPFQIAIGGAGESTIHPDWVEFVKTVRNLNIVPNYTTNGMHLSNDVLSATEKYCGGVAISYHPHIKKVFRKSVDILSELNTRLNVHIIIGSKQSLIDLYNIFDFYKEKIEYFVLLPYQAAGRASNIETKSTWKEMFSWVSNSDEKTKNKFAFGALFYNYFIKNDVDLNINIYEPELYSGYRVFDESYKQIRISSYNTDFKEIK